MLFTDHGARRAHGPILHYGICCIAPVGALRTGLDHLVERLIAKAPVAARWAVEPHVSRQMRAEMMLRPFQAGVLMHGVERGAVLQLEVIDELNVRVRLKPDFSSCWNFTRAVVDACIYISRTDV